MMNKLNPLYSVFVTVGGKQIALMYGKRCTQFKHSTTYTISLQQNTILNSQRFLLGKLKTKQKGTYNLYDSGKNPEAIQQFSASAVRL